MGSCGELRFVNWEPAARADRHLFSQSPVSHTLVLFLPPFLPPSRGTQQGRGAMDLTVVGSIPTKLLGKYRVLPLLRLILSTYDPLRLTMPSLWMPMHCLLRLLMLYDPSACVLRVLITLDCHAFRIKIEPINTSCVKTAKRDVPQFSLQEIKKKK